MDFFLVNNEVMVVQTVTLPVHATFLSYLLGFSKKCLLLSSSLCFYSNADVCFLKSVFRAQQPKTQLGGSCWSCACRARTPEWLLCDVHHQRTGVTGNFPHLQFQAIFAFFKRIFRCIPQTCTEWKLRIFCLCCLPISDVLVV